jgi:flagellar biosynthesis protein FliR
MQALTPNSLSGVDYADIISVFGSSALLWQVGLIFIRLGIIAMLLPGLGDQSTPPRLRLSFSLVLSMMLVPVLGSYLPPLPQGLSGVVYQIVHELFIGLLLGTLIRVFISALTIAGEVVSLQTTLSFAQTTNPTQAQPTASLGTFLALLGLVLIYAMNLHHLFIEAMIDSYKIFPASRDIMLGDAASLMIKTVAATFVMAMQISAPVIAFALIFNIATGFVGRIMPQFPVFFAATPLSVMLGLSVLALSLGVSGLVFIEHYQDLLSVFIRGKS